MEGVDSGLRGRGEWANVVRVCVRGGGDGGVGWVFCEESVRGLGGGEGIIEVLFAVWCGFSNSV